MATSTNLHNKRMHAAERSGGTSASVIKQAILKCLDGIAEPGRLLDYGAGKGELLTLLHNSGRFPDISGFDILPRPEHLPETIKWLQADLNDLESYENQFDIVICSETIEHLENPRAVFRQIDQLLSPGGRVILTMPNQESIRSILGLILRGHFIHFLGDCYPAHITALLRLDLSRMCSEVGFQKPVFLYTDSGSLPKLPKISWQQISAGLLKGRLFSDNLIMTTQKDVHPNGRQV